MNKTLYQTPLNSINTLTIEVEEAFNNELSVIAYDNEGGIWIEQFAVNIDEAQTIANKLHTSLLNSFK